MFIIFASLATSVGFKPTSHPEQKGGSIQLSYEAIKQNLKHHLRLMGNL
jgi:hypothetical protein